MFEVRVRPASDADLDGCISIVNETQQRCPGAASVAADTVATYPVSGLAAPREFLLASLGVGEAPIGTVGTRRAGSWGLVSYLSVIQGMRRQGIGRAMVRHALDHLQAPRVLALCWPIEAFLVFFGEALGWRPVGEYVRYDLDLSARDQAHAADARGAPARSPGQGFPLFAPPGPGGDVAAFEAAGGSPVIARHEPGDPVGELYPEGPDPSPAALRDASAWLADAGARSAVLWIYTAENAAPRLGVAAEPSSVWAVFDAGA